MIMEYILFFAMAFLAIVFGLMVVFHKNPIHSALSLVALLFNTAGLYALLQGEFIAVVQVLVYTGAIMVLFVFVIMLLNLKREELELHRLGWHKYVGAFFMLIIGIRLAVEIISEKNADMFSIPSKVAGGFGTVESVGESMLGHYVMPFEAVGVLLLAAIVGGVVLGKKRL